MRNFLLAFMALFLTHQASASCTASFTSTFSPLPGASRNVTFNNTSTFTSPPGGALVYYIWNFGDGGSLSYGGPGVQNHNYPSNGTYNATLLMIAYDSLTNSQYCRDSVTQTVTVGFPSCGSDFTFAYDTSALNGKVTFTATTPSGTSGMIYTWNFGDGSGSATGTTVTHTFNWAGYFSVKLIATNGTCYDSIVKTVSPHTCNGTEANFHPTATTGNTVSIGNASYVPYNFAATYLWDFGDGTTSTSPTVGTHTFPSSGTYTVSLKVIYTDSAQGYTCRDSMYRLVNTVNSPCYNKHASAAMGVNGYTVDFSNTSTAASVNQVKTYLWDFGDGTTSTAKSPSHTYSTGITYPYITLAVTWTDTVTNAVCFDSVGYGTMVPYNYQCAGAYASFSSSMNQGNATFYNNSGSYNPGQVKTYLWDFGDSTFSTLANPTHHYPNIGVYTVTLTTTFTDTTGGANNCVKAESHVVNPWNNNPSPCANHISIAGFALTGNATYSFTNNSAVFSHQTRHAYWNFGDGTTSTSMNVTHTYTSTGTFNIAGATTWTNDTTGAIVCTDTTHYTFSLVSQIQGAIIVDSSTTPTVDTFDVWLIRYDSLTNSLSAVDSQLTYGITQIPYAFLYQPAGVYYTKAKMHYQTVGSAGYVPTYHDSSLYWSTATPIYHSGIISSNQDIYMQQGIVTSGPGFVAGNVSLGANKGTGNGVPNMLVYLRNANNQLVQSGYTDANGDFSFSNLPLGTYSLYPELMNYITTPITNISITANHTSATGYRFGQTTTEIKPKTTGVENVTKATYLLYPNPANNKVIVRWGDVNGTADITITDIAGHKVFQSENIRMTGSTEINISSLQSGLYFVKVVANGMQEVGKIVIQH